MGLLFQQAVQGETSPINREDIVVVGVQLEQYVIRKGDLPVGHMESVILEMLLLGCVFPMELPVPIPFVIRDQLKRLIALMDPLRFPTGVHNHLWFSLISDCSRPNLLFA